MFAGLFSIKRMLHTCPYQRPSGSQTLPAAPYALNITRSRIFPGTCRACSIQVGQNRTARRLRPPGQWSHRRSRGHHRLRCRVRLRVTVRRLLPGVKGRRDGRCLLHSHHGRSLSGRRRLALRNRHHLLRLRLGARRLRLTWGTPHPRQEALRIALR